MFQFRLLCVSLILQRPGYALFESGKRYLQAQGLFKAATYVLLICAPVNALLNWLLVWVCPPKKTLDGVDDLTWPVQHPTIGVGFKGAPIAVCITDWLMAILLFGYVRFVAGKECWGGFTKRALVNWTPMIKLAVPGFIMLGTI